MNKTISFLVSGRGSNFKVIADNIINKTIPANLGCLISDKANAFALKTAESLNIPNYHVDPKQFKSKQDYEIKLAEIFSKHGTDLIAAAGYMRIISPYLIRLYPNRIMNIHPALLPSFAGLNAQEQAIKYGVKISGCTVHFVDEGMDTGPIIIQRIVNIHEDDNDLSLSDKILKEEHIAYSEAIKLFCENRLKVEGRKVKIL